MIVNSSKRPMADELTIMMALAKVLGESLKMAVQIRPTASVIIRYLATAPALSITEV